MYKPTLRKRVYNQLTQEEAEQLIWVIKKRLVNVVNKHMIKGFCSKKEQNFLLSNLNRFKVPHFYIIWKILKNPVVGRHIVAGYNWILSPASIFVGDYLKVFCTKFDSILMDNLSLVKFFEKVKVWPGRFPFYSRLCESIYEHSSSTCNWINERNSI